MLFLVVGALHFGEIRGLFLGGTELGVFGLRFGAFASVSAYLLELMNSNLPAVAATILFWDFSFCAGEKNLHNLQQFDWCVPSA